jgi:hypothetical protein
LAQPPVSSEALAVSADGAMRLWDLRQDSAEHGIHAGFSGEVQHLFAALKEVSLGWLKTSVLNINPGIPMKVKTGEGFAGFADCLAIG